MMVFLTMLVKINQQPVPNKNFSKNKLNISRC